MHLFDVMVVLEKKRREKLRFCQGAVTPACMCDGFPSHTTQVLWKVRPRVIRVNLCYSCSTDTHRWFTPKISGTVPGARDGHSACVLGKAMYIFGGYEQLVSLITLHFGLALVNIKTWLINLLCCFLGWLLLQWHPQAGHHHYGLVIN